MHFEWPAVRAVIFHCSVNVRPHQVTSLFPNSHTYSFKLKESLRVGFSLISTWQQSNQCQWEIVYKSFNLIDFPKIMCSSKKEFKERPLSYLRTKINECVIRVKVEYLERQCPPGRWVRFSERIRTVWWCAAATAINLTIWPCKESGAGRVRRCGNPGVAARHSIR